MNIGLAIRELDSARGGGERYCVTLCRQLVALGHDIHAFAVRWRDVPKGLTLHRVDASRHSASLRVKSFARNCARLLASGTFDVTIGLAQVPGVDVYRAGGGLQRFWMRERFPNPIARWARMTVRPVHGANIALEDRIFAPGSATHVIAVSQLCARQLRDIYNTPPERVTVIHNGTDLSPPALGERDEASARLHREFDIPPESPVLVHASNNFARKGVATTIRALASPELRQVTPRAHFVVLGRGEPSGFLALARRLGLAGRVHFAGPVADVAPYFRGAELSVMMSGYDPFPNAVVESMVSGTPAVVSANTGATDIISDGGSGYIVDDWRDWRTLAQAIARHLTSADRAKISRSATCAVAELTPRANALAVEKVLKKVAARKRGELPTTITDTEDPSG